ncbi:DUF1697 domain-containing protein [Deinococcus multiflagellatus]|uniref:DUF1697 domain-containing protein n=1 Tax=Deinococcus multiflagellatus TaxID=1656887 RepID=A0ABW1ZMH7_9DEIO|nr:DUF1697 domain-containing protein [Deinococcus multiflagellatus]MBZ9712633.1 DUF1697 domain-containing protein [Deinococcus multiflagellatus]
MRFVALLHAVNLGKARKVNMAQLRALLGTLGLSGVQTYIQSGNALFDADPDPELGLKLETALGAHFGFSIPVTLRTADDWQQTARACPTDLLTEPVTVAFLTRQPAPDAVAALQARDVRPERWALVGQQVYQTVPEGTRNLRLSQAVLTRVLGVPCTARHWRTVQAIAEQL